MLAEQLWWSSLSISCTFVVSSGSTTSWYTQRNTKICGFDFKCFRSFESSMWISIPRGFQRDHEVEAHHYSLGDNGSYKEWTRSLRFHRCVWITLGRHSNIDAKEELDLDVLVQRHENIQRHWSVTEKEALPIVEAVDKLRHILLSNEGFEVLTDHRNQICVFDPIWAKMISKNGSRQAISMCQELVDFQIRHWAHSWGIRYLGDTLTKWKRKKKNRSLDLAQ